MVRCTLKGKRLFQDERARKIGTCKGKINRIMFIYYEIKVGCFKGAEDRGGRGARRVRTTTNEDSEEKITHNIGGRKVGGRLCGGKNEK